MSDKENKVEVFTNDAYADQAREQQVMKSIMENCCDIIDDAFSGLAKQQAAIHGEVYNSNSDNSLDAYYKHEDNGFGQIDTGSYFHQTPVHSEKWTLTESKFSGIKDQMQYGIVFSPTGDEIMEGILLKEAAIGLCKLLNEGHKINDQKVLFLLGEGLQYSRLLEHSMKIKKTLNEGASSERVSSNMRQAKVIRTKVRDFLFDNNLIG